MQIQLTEENLVNGIRNHDSKALEWLYKQYYPTVRNYVLQNSGDADEAQDIFQDGMIALWDNITNGRYESRADKGIGAYLVQICKFRWLEKTKSARFRKTKEWNDNFDQPEQDSRLANLIDREEADYATGLMGKLGEKCQEILTLFYYEKKSMQEIGTTLTMQPDSVKNEKYRCMQRLKKLHLEVQNKN
jgi:RNA polymerase sigma factor (sigma-70 family)